jgi:hypothetical protein
MNLRLWNLTAEWIVAAIPNLDHWRATPLPADHDTLDVNLIADEDQVGLVTRCNTAKPIINV